MKIVKGDIFDVANRGIIGHQCNACYVMGAGIAKKIADMYPNVLEAYINERPALGECQLVEVGNDLWIANLIGQANTGSGLQTDYEALRKAMSSLRLESEDLNLPVYLPYGLGCVLAGGDWIIVSRIIEAELPKAIIVRLNG